MSANPLLALQLVLERAEADRDEALTRLRQAEQRAEAMRRQQEELAQYRSDYRQRWTRSFARSTTTDILACYQTFGTRLDQAVSHQDTVSQQADQGLARARQQLQEKELRVASVRKLLERRQLEQRRLEERREQRATDEQAARTVRGAGFSADLRLRA